MKNLLLTLLISSAWIATAAQTPNIDSLITEIFTRLDAIEFYEADAAISVDVDFIEMPDKVGHVAYMAPDSFRVDTDGFIMIPKIGMKPLTRQLDLTRYQAVYSGTEEIDGREYVVANLLPKKRNGRVVMATAWIDNEALKVARIETFTKKNGSYTVDLEYGDHVLPSKLLISFEIEGMNIPMKYFGPDVAVDKQEMNSEEITTGTVTVEFSNYDIRMRSGS